MSIDDKIFWLVVTMPIIQNVICFILGSIIGAVAMSIADAVEYYQDPYTIEGGEDDGV